MTASTAFGPQGPNYATTRPPADPKASAGADTWFKNCSAAGAKDGTFATADFFNVTLGNLRYLVRTAGVALDDLDDTMVYQAVRAIGRPYYAVDQGTANHIVATLAGVTAITEGMIVLVRVAFNNTGAVDLNINGLGAISVTHVTGSAVLNGEIAGNAIIGVVFDGTKWQLVWTGLGSTGSTTGPVYLQASQDYYVNATTGSDLYDGLAATVGAGHGPFQTLQKAADTVNKFNLNGFGVTVHVADGNYSSFTLPSPGGSGIVSWVGNPANPSAVIVTGIDHSAITGLNTGTQTLNGFKVQSSGNPVTFNDNLTGINIAYASNVSLSNIDFGACSGAQLQVSRAAAVTLSGAIKISGSSAGNAFSAGSFLACFFGGLVQTNSLSLPSLTVSASVALTYFVYATLSGSVALTFSGITGAGSVTGTKYLATGNGVISTGGAGINYYPGTVAGSTASGGQYI